MSALKTYPSKLCKCCGREFFRPRLTNGKLEDSRHWKARVYCTNYCKHKAWRKKFPALKHCLNCGELIPRRIEKDSSYLWGERLERPSRYKKRKFCDDSCRHLYWASTDKTTPDKLNYAWKLWGDMHEQEQITTTHENRSDY